MTGSLHLFGVAIGLGMIVIGAALGIGRFASAAAEGIARQPSAADKITGAVNLPLFLLEGVAILAEVFVLLIVLLTSGRYAEREKHAMNPLVQADPGLFIWTIVTFLVLLALLAKFAWRPLLAALETRQDAIRKSLDDAQLARQELERLNAESAQIIASARVRGRTRSSRRAARTASGCARRSARRRVPRRTTS